MSLFLGLWALAFVYLAVSLLVLFLYFRLLGSDLDLNSLPKEGILALVVSAAEAGCLWSVGSLLAGGPPTLSGARTEMLIPIIITPLPYKLAHLKDWDQYEVPGLLLFQLVVSQIGESLVAGDVRLAFIVLTAFVSMLVLFGALTRDV